MPDSPADKAGLKFGDRIVAVDGKKAKKMKQHELINKISGSAGTEVTLKIQKFTNPANKEKGEIFEKKIVREKLLNKKLKKDLAYNYGLRSLIYRAKGESEQSFSDAQKAIDFNPESFEAQLAWGLTKIDKKQYKEALGILTDLKVPEIKRLYNLSPYFYFVSYPSDDEIIKIAMAKAYLGLDQISKAINYIPNKELPPSLAPIWTEAQSLTTELDRLAHIHNQKAVNLDRKGFMKSALKEYTLALTYINNEIKEKEIRNNLVNLVSEFPYSPRLPEKARNYMLRADVSIKQKDLKSALAEYKKALKIAPYISKLYYNVALVYSNLKNYDKAVEYMSIYIKADPKAKNIQFAKDQIVKWEFLLEKK